MELGSLTERHLENAVFREINSKLNKVETGAGIGNDYSRVGDIVTADGSADRASAAWVKAVNNFSCSGAKVAGARILMLVPEGAKESMIKKSMGELESMAEKTQIPIVGGHTQVSSSVSKAVFTVTVFGTASCWRADRKAVKTGQAIVMCGYAGMLGTDILLEKHRDYIREKFGAYFSKGYVFGAEKCLVNRAADLAINNATPLVYMHDISCGGVYTALWQLGRWADCGIAIDNKRIPIMQETIEICESLDKNPYLCDGTGGLLLICDEPELVVNNMNSQGIVAAIIGRITGKTTGNATGSITENITENINNKKERTVAFGDGELRTLTPASGDEVYG